MHAVLVIRHDVLAEYMVSTMTSQRMLSKVSCRPQHRMD